MGEAKRRKDAERATIKTLDVQTGEVIEARNAGDPLTFRDRMAHNMEDLKRGKVATSDVPCNGCRQCCYHAGVDLTPDEDTSHLDTERRADGKLYLRKRADGACVHLGPEGCTVYEHRPAACRAYDCRMYALFGVLDSYDGDHRQPVWAFQARTLEGRAFVAACHALGIVAYRKRLAEGKSCSASDVAWDVLRDERFDRTVGAFTTLGRMAPDELVKVLGFDPRETTREQMLAAGRALYDVKPADK